MSHLVGSRGEKALREIGLTEYETNAYIALVQFGESTAGQISESTSIPHSKVYGYPSMFKAFLERIYGKNF